MRPREIRPHDYEKDGSRMFTVASWVGVPDQGPQIPGAVMQVRQNSQILHTAHKILPRNKNRGQPHTAALQSTHPHSAEGKKLDTHGDRRDGSVMRVLLHSHRDQSSEPSTHISSWVWS